MPAIDVVRLNQFMGSSHRLPKLATDGWSLQTNSIGKSWRMFYFEDEPGAAISGQQGGLLRISSNCRGCCARLDTRNAL